MLGNFDIDAGITYLDHEPLGNVTCVPLWTERYQLIVAEDGPLSDRKEVTWAEVAQAPLCLLTSDMQNRRIIDQYLAATGTDVRPSLESNSTIVLLSHLRTRQWASIMPLDLGTTFSLGGPIRRIPIVDPVVSHCVGLVVARRDIHTPLVAGLLSVAARLSD